MQTIYLDISNRRVPLIVFAKQGDVGRKFKAVITNGGADYDIPEGTVLSVWYSGSSGEGNYSAIGAKSAFAIEGNTVVIELIAQMLVSKGGGMLCLVMNDADGNQVGLWNVPYVAEEIPGMDSPEAEQNFTAFSEAAAKIADIAQQAMDAASTFTTDTALKEAGKAADAEAVGIALDGKVSTKYGLGVPAAKATSVSSADDASLATGVYLCTVNTEGLPSTGWGGGVLLVLQKDGDLCRQIVFDSDLSDYCMRWYHDGTWEAWEYSVPPMTVGVEYRTTERYMGKPVYTKLVDFGESENGKEVVYSDIWVTPIRYAGTITKTNGWTTALPLICINTSSGINLGTMCNIYVTSNNIYMMCGDDYIGQQTYVQIWYVK